MLNTGLSLRRPFESDYGAFKRFLNSNNNLSKTRLADNLRLYAKSNEFHYPGYHSLLALRHEMAFCQRNHIPYLQPTPVCDREVRNCWKCASIGYHSYLYQWMWLDRCPIHNKRISTRCRRCGKHWPRLHELINRRCSTCGGHSTRDQLKRLGGFVNHREFDTLNAVKNMELDYSASVKLRLLNTKAVWCPFILDEHRCVPVDNQHFASVAASQSEETCQALSDMNVRFRKAVKMTFDLAVENRSPDAENTLSQEQKNAARERVIRKINRAVANTTGNRQQMSFQRDIEFRGISAETNIYLFAFTVWHCIISERPGGRRAYMPGLRYFQTCLGEDLPLIPVPMDRYSIEGQGEATWPAPVALQTVVYEIDLWCCYKSILKYFDALKRNIEPSNWSHFLKDLPDWAYPGRHYSSAVSTFLREDGTIELIIPPSVIEVSFKSLKLQS